MSVRFCPIASGSSGNCIFVGTNEANVLIDAGISGVSIIEGLKRINVQPSEIDAIFITHDHSDHIKGAGIFSRKFDVPIYANEGTWSIMERTAGKLKEHNIVFRDTDKPFRFKDMEVIPFKIPHDAGEPVGYVFFSQGVKVTFATDIGVPDDTIKEMIKDSDIILLETNHDVEMLKKGPYPFYLKKRILSNLGHLSNDTAAGLLSSSVSDRLKHVYLAHLSAENNSPRLALETVYKRLKEDGKINGRYTLRCAERSCVSPLVEV